jgi:dihydrofolate synthase/folylpolyglutamate synthase
MDVQTDYQKTLDYLYDKLPMFSRLGSAAIKKDLTNTIKLCEAIGNPQEKFKSIHIAGTNGKGSSSHMLSAIMQQSGYKTGLYTSPHLVDFRERIRIDGEPVTKEWVIDFVTKHKDAIEIIEPSFFEVTVAMAFAAFAEAGVDIAIIETGLGGRLDSTNVITPVLSIITNISYDHVDLLGHTLPEIATEKAGIIKQNIPVVIGEQNQETSRVFFEHAVHKQTTLYYADAMWDLVRTSQSATHQHYKAIHRAKREMFDLSSDMQGAYQYHNIKTVLAATELLIALGYNIQLETAFQALSKVKKLTGLKGRWDVLQAHPLIIADVAHNPAGLKEVIQQWQRVEAAHKHIVLGFVKDKDVNTALSLFPKDNTYYFCNAQMPRALQAAELQKMAAVYGLEGNVYETVADAVSSARDAMQQNDALLSTGSFFITGEAITYLNVNNGMLFPTALE